MEHLEKRESTENKMYGETKKCIETKEDLETKEYTVRKLSRLAGVSPRTLRYYHQIGILAPARINSSGYRVYGQAEVDRLQQILFYRELGVSLKEIRKIVTAPSFDAIKALQEHRKKLLAKREQLDLLLANIDKTIAQKKGGRTMTDQEKFEGFKRRLIAENEQKYGKEIREKYGDAAVEQSNKAFLEMTEAQYAEWGKLGVQVLETLKEAVATGDPAGELAQKTADLHRQWLTRAWGGGYSKEAHAGLAQMYVDDPRFKAYYDQQQPGGAEFLRDAILIYTGTKE